MLTAQVVAGLRRQDVAADCAHCLDRGLCAGARTPAFTARSMLPQRRGRIAKTDRKGTRCVRQRTEEKRFERTHSLMNSSYAPLNPGQSAAVQQDAVSLGASLFMPLARAVRDVLPWLGQSRSAVQVRELDSESAMDSPCL